MLFDLSIIEPPQKIFLFHEGEKTRYVSYIREIDNRVIFADRPDSQELFLSAGDSICVQLPVPGQLYQFAGTVLQHRSNPDLLGISVPERVDRVEMRKFIRVKKTLRVQYAVLPANGDPVYKAAESINISAGGMQLAVSEYIGEGKQLVLQFIISQDNKYSSFKEMSRVISVIPDRDKEMFHIGVEFLNIKQNKLDIISRYVMKTLWTEAML